MTAAKFEHSNNGREMIYAKILAIISHKFIIDAGFGDVVVVMFCGDWFHQYWLAIEMQNVCAAT